MKQYLALLLTLWLLTSCATIKDVNDKLISAPSEAQFSTATPTVEQLRALPKPKGLMTAAVYSFRDQTGQYKPTLTGSSFSTAVTQGGSSILVQALRESGWFIPMEREGLQNILTERKIIRAAQQDPNKEIQPLRTAQILFEGGVIGYSANTKTGGLGAAYFGIDLAEQYREDQVTVYLRAVDVRSGAILASISSSKSVFSREVTSGFFRYVSFKKLAEAEGGYTENEPSMIATRQAIEKAVAGLIVKGIQNRVWSLSDEKDIHHPVISQLIDELS